MYILYLGLKKYTKYLVEVSSSTVKGEGPQSAPLDIITDEDGKVYITGYCVVFISVGYAGVKAHYRRILATYPHL